MKVEDFPINVTLHSERFSQLPPDQYVPDNVKALIDRLRKVRERETEALQHASEARQNIVQADHDATVKAARAIADGDMNARPDHKKVDNAKTEFDRALRELDAITKAHAQIENELAAAFRENGDATVTLAADAVESTREVYRQAFSALMKARAEFLTANGALAFARESSSVRPSLMLSFRVSDGSAIASSYALMQAEINPPSIPETVTNDATNMTRQTGNRVPL